jgi:hypothetical protein
MPGWVEAFIVIAAIAIVIQTAILAVTLISVQQTAKQLIGIITNLQTRIDPILTRSNRILEDSETRISSILGDAAEIGRLSRAQVQKVDRIFTDAVERLRLQVVRADQILTGTLEVVEEAGSTVRRTVWGPLTQASALIKGIKTGLEFFRNQNKTARPETSTQDEELFI